MLNQIKKDPWTLFVPAMIVLFLIILITQAHGQDVKNQNDRDELAELRKENEILREEKGELLDKYWTISKALNDLDAKYKRLEAQVEGEEE